MMKAFVIKEAEKTDIIERPAPEPGREEVLLTVHSVGLCGSDLSTFLGKNPLVSYPRIPGHEIAAVVEECGADVPEQIKPGTPVTVVPYSNCGTCSACRAGRAHACRNNQTLGVQRDGALCEQICVPWRKVIPSAGGTGRGNEISGTKGGSPKERDSLVLTEPLSVGFHAVARGGVTDTDTAAVIGTGMIGLGAVARAALRGARVIAVDLDEEKLETARAMGAGGLINAARETLAEGLGRLCGRQGPSVVIEAVGSPQSYRAAVEAAAFAGRVVCIGYAQEDALLPTKLFVQKELDIRGSRNAADADFRAVREYLSRGRLPFERIISQRVSLSEAGEALAYWAENRPIITKIVVEV